MSNAEIFAIVLISFIALVILFTYLLHGRKLTKKQKSEKKKEVKIVEEIKKEPEQKPVPVGIIKEDKKQNVENEFAPFKEIEKKETKVESTKSKNQSLQEEIKSLSPEMKKVIMSDILKPRF